MASLPVFNTTNDSPSSSDFMQMQNRWKGQLDPLLKSPTNNSVLIKGIVLAIGVNVINHRLGRLQQGWIVTDIDGAAVIYRSAAFNDKTLTLMSDAVVTISLECF